MDHQPVKKKIQKKNINKNETYPAIPNARLKIAEVIIITALIPPEPIFWKPKKTKLKIEKEG